MMEVKMLDFNLQEAPQGTPIDGLHKTQKQTLCTEC